MLDTVSPERLQGFVDIAVEHAITYVPQLLLTLLLLLVGLWVIKRVVGVFSGTLARGDTDVTLARFLTNLVSVGLKALLFISLASMVGIETTSFIAVLGAAGLAIGLALQGSLSNFAGGVLILLFRPFKVGDFIEAQGVSGTVKSIQIFNTLLNTPDNKLIVLPNGDLSNGVIQNYSAEPTRRVDFVFGIGYDDDVARAKEVLESLLADDARVLAEPASKVVVSGLGDNAVDITVRAWVNAADYWDVYFDLTEAVKARFDQQAISFPYPQRDVHLYGTAGQ